MENKVTPVFTEEQNSPVRSRSNSSENKRKSQSDGMRVRPTSTPDCFSLEFMMKGWSWAVDTFIWKYQSMQIKAVIRKRDRLKDERRPDHLISRTHIFPCCFTALVASAGELHCSIVVGRDLEMSIRRHLILSDFENSYPMSFDLL